MQRNDATLCSPCGNLFAEEKSVDFSAFVKFCEITDKFNDTFANFDLLKAKMEVSNYPIDVGMESQPPYLQQNYGNCNRILFFYEQRMNITT